jgi:WD40 repeat protein
VGQISLATHYLGLPRSDGGAAMLGLAVAITGVLVVAWRLDWPRWSAGWIGYALIVAQIVPLGLEGGYTLTGWLLSQVPPGLETVLLLADVLLCFGVGVRLAGRDRPSGLLVAQPALMLWLWLASDAVHSALGLTLLIGAGLATAVSAASIVRSSEKSAIIRLAVVAALGTRLPFTYAGLYHHDFAPPPPTLQGLVVAIRDGLIAVALVTGPLWAQALWKRIRRLATRALSGRGDERGSSRGRSFSESEASRVLRRWWFIAPVLIAIVALATGARPPGRWLDTALNASGCLGILEEHESPVQSVAFSPDGTFLASGSGDGTARVWQVDRGPVSNWTLHHTLRIPTGEREGGYSHDVAFSPDGAKLAFGLPDGTVRLWHLSNDTRHPQATRLHTLRGDTGKVCSLAFSPDGETLAAGTWGGPVHLWRVSDGTLLRSLQGHSRGVVDIAFSPSGVTLASASLDRTVTLWDVARGAPVHTIRGPSMTTAAAFSPDGSMLAAGRRLWSVGDWTPIRGLQSARGGMGNVAFSPDGSMLAAGNAWYEVRWWSVSDGALLRAVKGYADSVNSVAFSPDGRLLASGSLDGTVRLWRVPSSPR